MFKKQIMAAAAAYDGKLYIDFNTDANDTFRKNPAELVKQAVCNWPGLNH